MKRTFVLIVIWLFLFSFLTGCAVLEQRGENDVVSGIGKSYESRGDSDTDMERLQMDVLAQCEDRVPKETTLIDVLNNSLGWTQAVTTITTQGERSLKEIIGGDRAEKVATFSLDNPHKAESIPAIINAWANAIDTLDKQTQSCDVFVASTDNDGDTQ